MVRRDFLKLGGLFSAALLVGIGPAVKLPTQPVQVEQLGNIYRGSPDGTIHISEDGGQTWRLHTRFGEHLSIAGLYVDLQQRVVAVLDCQGYDFCLALLPGSRTWKTA